MCHWHLHCPSFTHLSMDVEVKTLQIAPGYLWNDESPIGNQFSGAFTDWIAPTQVVAVQKNTMK